VYNYCYEDKYELEDVENRRLYLNSEVDESVVDNLVYHIFRFNRLDKDLPVDERKPIILYINSPGGSVTDGFALIDAIIQSKTPVYTVNIGSAYSMGFLIFIAGKHRYSMPNATFLCHDGSSVAWDSMSKLKDRVEFEAGQMEEHTKDYILAQTDITDKMYERNKRIEWYFYPDEGKKLGVVTHIVGTDCDFDSII
ncbi:MAG: ATP-dependent Clp protease proteolytic subunit, partial [Prevotella sp.]|nr:ATP-dependent Clp protease proteolytic subunit [Prevotella sp.]